MNKASARNSISNVNNHALCDGCLSIKRHGHVKSEVIKNNLEYFFPSTENVTNNNAFQTRVRHMRLLPMLLETSYSKNSEKKLVKVTLQILMLM